MATAATKEVKGMKAISLDLWQRLKHHSPPWPTGLHPISSCYPAGVCPVPLMGRLCVSVAFASLPLTHCTKDKWGLGELPADV